ASSFEGYFIEMNTRIQVEHPVTEMVTGRDLVAMQLELARGSVRHIAQSEMRPRGHAIECRLYAENPDKNFLPSPGKLSVLELPAAGEGRRVDTGFQAGDTITPFYDPMIAKLKPRAGSPRGDPNHAGDACRNPDRRRQVQRRLPVADHARRGLRRRQYHDKFSDR